MDQANVIINALNLKCQKKIILSDSVKILGITYHPEARFVNSIIYETKWQIWKFRNERKFERNNVSEIKYVRFLKYNITEILLYDKKCRHLQHILDELDW